MPQYYNGITRPVLDGIDGTGAGSASALDHYKTTVEDFFDGDATRIVFGFCISDCGYTSSNAGSSQAVTFMTELSVVHGCNDGAFFGVAQNDKGGSWSAIVNQAMAASSTCSSSSIPLPAPLPSPTPMMLAPIAVSAPTTNSPTTDAPTTSQPTPKAPIVQPTPSGASTPCCPPGYTGLRAYTNFSQYHHCQSGEVIRNVMNCPAGLLFSASLQVCNWAGQVVCSTNMSC